MAIPAGTVWQKVQLVPFAPPVWMPVGSFAQGVKGDKGDKGEPGQLGPQGRPGIAQVMYINVQDFGARGNGSADDTAAIQAAINAAGGNAAGGIVVWFPPGVYICNALLTLSGSVVTLAAINGSAVLKKKSGATPSVLRITGSYCNILDLQFDGSNVPLGNSGIELYGTFNKIMRCYSSNNTGHGIALDGSTGGGLTASNNWVCDCYCHHNSGIGISMNTATDNLIQGNSCYFNSLEGITVDIVAYRNRIMANWVSQNCQTGGAGNISLDQADISIIQGNQVHGAAGSGHGIVCNNQAGQTNFVIIQGNMVFDNAGKGIYLKSGSGGTSSNNSVTGNTCRGNASNQIRADASCNNNVIVGNSLNGSAVSDAGASNSVANNT